MKKGKIQDKQSDKKVERKDRVLKKEDGENKGIAFSGELFSEVIVKNPVLVSTIGLCPVVAICISLKSALLLSVITYLTMILAQLLTALFIKACPQWVRVALYALVGTIVVAPSMVLLENVFPGNLIALGIYLPLLAINPLVTRQCERVAVKSSVKVAIINALSCATGYSAVLLITGFLRELFGLGTIWDIKVISLPTATALTNPFGGFIVIGFMAALLRVYFKRIDPEYAEQLAVESRTAIKKPKQKKSKPKVRVVEYNPNGEYLREDTESQSIQTAHAEAQTNHESEQEKSAQSVEAQENVEADIKESVAEDKQAQDIPQKDVKEEPVKPKKVTKRKKIEYTSQELEELLSKSLDDLINGSFDNKGQKSDGKNIGEVQEK